MANAWLILFILIFWIGLWLLVKIGHLVHGRPLSDGPSFIPLVPILPVIAYCVGWGLDRMLPWLGFAVIAATHVGYLLFMYFSTRRSGDVA